MAAGPKLVTNGPLSSRHARWSAGDVLVCCVVAKASLRFSTDGTMQLVAPDPLVLGDQLQPGVPEPAAELLRAGEMVPVKQRADVLLHATAVPPLGTPREHIEIRLAVGDLSEWLIDKRLSVTLPSHAPALGTPLRYAHAAHDVDNPAGVAEQPLILSPDSNPGAVGVAPIAAHWPQRARFMTAKTQRALDAGRYPWSLDERFFQAAPLDQQLRHLRGDERILLQGINATTFEIVMKLPGLAVDALLWRASDTNSEVLAMVADTLVIDADAQRCDIVWRAQLVMTAGELDDTRVEVTLGSRQVIPKKGLAAAEPHNLKPRTMAVPLVHSANISPPWQPSPARPAAGPSSPLASPAAAEPAAKRRSATTIGGTLKLIDLPMSVRAALPEWLADAQLPPVPRKGPRVPLLIEWPQYAADSFTHQLKGSPHQLVIAVKARAQLVSAEPASWQLPAVPLCGDVSENGARLYASDYAPFKSECDVTVVGTKIGNTWESHCVVGDDNTGMRRELRRRNSRQWCAPDGGPASFGPRVPSLPADATADDWQSAPVEQRMAAVRGDERYSLEGLSDAPLQGELPGHTAVCFAQRCSGEVERVPLRLDTVAFDVAEQHVTLVWRGRIDVVDDEARDVAELFISDTAVGSDGPSTAEAVRRWRTLRDADAPAAASA